MALPPIDVNEDLEAEDEDLEPLEGDEDAALDEVPADAPDAMFAADIAEAFPELEDAQIMALQRAVLGLIGGMSGGAPPAPPMGF